MTDPDVIIIGAGHNAMVCAGYLAQKGRSVLIIEQSNHCGGLASTREFFPGFKASVAHTIQNFSSKVIDDLSLTKHGLDLSQYPLQTIGLSRDGECIRLDSSKDQPRVSGLDEKDEQAYAGYMARMQTFADMLKPFWLTTIPRIGSANLQDMTTFLALAVKLRLLGKDEMGEFMRIATLPIRDLMDENFESDLLKAVLSWDGLLGSKMAPRSPNATVLSVLYKMAEKDAGAPKIPVSGIDGLVTALYKSARSSGVEFKLGQPVSRVLMDAGDHGVKAVGVVLADGDVIYARKIVSGVDPKQTFIDLVGVENLEIGFTNRINRLRCDGYVAKLHLALDSLPVFAGLDNPLGRLILVSNMDSIEFAYDDAKYGEFSDRPVMELILPTLCNPDMAPEGKHVLSGHVMYIPHHIKGGWTEEAHDRLYQNLIELLEHYAPGIREQIIFGELLTPKDLEHQYNLTGGHWHHAEMAIDQMFMMRPTYEAAQYSTPISGLFLCGAGCHPGGGLSGAPGHNAAIEILRTEQ